MIKLKSIKGILAGLSYFALFFAVQTVIAIVYIVGVTIFEITHNNLSFETTFIFQNGEGMITIISGIVYIGIIYLIFKIKRKNIFEEVSLRKIPIKSIIPMIIFGISSSFATELIFFQLIPFPERWYDAYNEAAMIFETSNLWIELLAGVIMAGIVEEICFRGLVYSRFKSVMPVYLAIILSAILFGSGHPSPIWFLYTAFSTILTIYFFEKFKSVTICIVEHMSFNFVAWFMQYVIGSNINWLETYQLYINIAMTIISIISFIWIVKLKVPSESEVTSDLELCNQK